MTTTELNSSRRELIGSLCRLGPIYVLSIFIEQNEMLWWRYVIGLVVFVIVGGVYMAIFKRFVCPKSVDSTKISTPRKYLCYLIVLICNLVGIFLVDYLPFDFIANLAISLIANCILTMTLCYYISKK